MKVIRIGNVEYKESANMANEPYREIVLWYPNPYYGSEEKMKSDGWTFDEDGDAHRENCHVHSSCFKNKESCYTVAIVEWNSSHDEFDVRSVGTRAFDLKGKDFKDFKRVLGLINDNDY